MGALNHSGKHLILSNRYALLGCIAVSAAGKVYRGRDLEQVKHQGLESRVLIHVLPTTTATWSLDTMFQHMCKTYQRVGMPWVLETLAYGQDEELAYFVLQSPDSWELQSLLSQSEIPQRCYRLTRQQINPLVKQGYLDAQIDPALLLCAGKASLYLLATAFAPEIQALEKRATHHQLMPRKHLGQALMTGGLLTLFGVFTAVAGNAVMKLNTVTPPPPPTAQLAAPRVVLASLPSTAVTTVAVTQLDQATPAVALDASPIEQQRPVAVVLEKKVVPPPVSKVVSPPVPEPVIAEPVVIPETTPPPIAAEYSGIDELIQRAYAAMEVGNLGASDGALHFARQLRAQAPQHPQVARLGQEITAAHLRQVRVALQTNDLEQAAQLLPMTRQLIQEFGLNNLIPAQQVLEDKTAELSAF